jgi:hypothetical protein
MKKEFDATKTFAKELVLAGADAVKEVGRAMEKTGDDLLDDRDPSYVVAKAVNGLHGAHLVFMRGALTAVEEALEVSRRGTRAPVNGRTEERDPKFALCRMNTLSVTGTANLDALKRLVVGWGYAPTALTGGPAPLGIVQVHFNDAADGYFGPCTEMLVTTAVGPAAKPLEIDWKFRDNPYFALKPQWKGHGFLLALGMYVDGPEEDAQFGREKLGIPKYRLPMPELRVGMDGATINVPNTLAFDLNLNADEADKAIDELAKGLGTTVRELYKDGPPSRFDVVARKDMQTDPRRWAWILDKASVPKLNKIRPEQFRYAPESEGPVGAGGRAVPDLRGLLRNTLDFNPLCSAWTFHIDAHVEWPVR